MSPTFPDVGDFTFKPIAFVKSAYPDKFGIPRQSGLVPHVYSEITLKSEFQPQLSLQGLEGYSHIWLVFVFHQNSSQRFHAKVHPPRLQGETMGLFATRSPHRPNPIGLSLVELVRLEKDTLIVSGADLVEGTPILDIKPYLPQYEAKPEARTGWTGQVDSADIEVVFTPEAESQLQMWAQKSSRTQLKETITAHLKLDPRPTVYKGFETDEQAPYRNKHAFRLYEGDINFEFFEKTKVRVFSITF